jgi:hypothetical protein
MSALDYYGRLMRRACARAQPRGRAIADPFDATAPWPATEAAAAASIENHAGPAPAALTPSAPSIVPIAPAIALIGPVFGRDHAEAKPDTSAPLATPDAHVSITPESPSAIPPFSQATTTRADAPPATRDREDEGRTSPRIVHDDPVVIEPAIGRRSVPIASLSTAPGRDEADASRQPVTIASLLTPAIPPRLPVHAAEPPRPDAPAVSIGRIDIEIDGARPSPAATDPPVVVVRESGGSAHDGGRMAQELLRGPTHQPFGIGQV